MRAAVAFLLAAVLCFGGGRAASASPDFDYPAAFNFGDSNSDTGGRIAAGFEPMPPPYGSTFFGAPSGRFSDGRLILDFLMDAMDMPFLNAYLDSLGAPNFRAGVNFAQAGCSITPASATSVSPFSFGLQIKQFFAFKEKVTRLLSQGDRYRRYIPQLDYFSKGLYMFDIGQNDLAGQFYSRTEDQVIASIPTILLEFETGLKVCKYIALHGSNFFSVHGLISCHFASLHFGNHILNRGKNLCCSSYRFQILYHVSWYYSFNYIVFQISASHLGYFSFIYNKFYYVFLVISDTIRSGCQEVLDSQHRSSWLLTSKHSSFWQRPNTTG
ncbi:hypothetical protein VPH35_009217 [Triticum aestivum]